MAKAPTKTIRVARNIWGNLVIFIGSRRELDFGVLFDAVDWVSEKLKEGGYVLSPKSDITTADVQAHRAKLGE